MRYSATDDMRRGIHPFPPIRPELKILYSPRGTRLGFFSRPNPTIPFVSWSNRGSVERSETRFAPTAAIACESEGCCGGFAGNGVELTLPTNINWPTSGVKEIETTLKSNASYSQPTHVGLAI